MDPDRSHPTHAEKLLAALVLIAAVASAWMLRGEAHGALGELADAGASLRSGDVLFLRGSGFLSRLVLGADARSDFSHTGILVRRGMAVVVVHAAPGEALEEVTAIRVEPLEVVLARSRAAVVYRFEEERGDLAARAALIAQRYAAEGRVFDAAFRLDTENELYCTELVWRAYFEAGVDLVDGHLDELSLPLFRQPCLLPSHLLTSRHLHLVRRF